MLGVAICVFALIVVAFGLAQRRLGARPTVPPVCVRWRLAAAPRSSSWPPIRDATSQTSASRSFR